MLIVQFSCIDCGQTFGQQSVQGHTQCISEAVRLSFTPSLFSFSFLIFNALIGLFDGKEID